MKHSALCSLSHCAKPWEGVWWFAARVDAEEVRGFSLGSARRPLDEQDGCGPAHGGDGRAFERCEVLLIPLRFEEGGDVFGAVAAAPRRCFRVDVQDGLAQGFGSGADRQPAVGDRDEQVSGARGVAR